MGLLSLLVQPLSYLPGSVTLSVADMDISMINPGRRVVMPAAGSALPGFVMSK